jgi:hypothetical protein
MGARNILEGNGFSRTSGGGEIYPETGFAPFLSFVLAASGYIGLDLFGSARIINVLLYGLNLYLAGYLLLRATHSPVVAAIGELFLLTSQDLFEWHALLMSEPLFIFLCLFTIYCLMEYFHTDRERYAAIAALTLGAATITRYAGVSMIPVAALLFMLFKKGSRQTRIRSAIVFCTAASIPFLLWFLRNQSLGSGGVANREIAFHPFRPEVIKLYLFQLTSWFIPEQIRLNRVIRAMLALVLGIAGPLFVCLIWLRNRVRFRSHVSHPMCQIFVGLLAFVPSYVAVLAINSLLLDAGTTYSGVIRYLVPLYVMAVLLEVISVAWLVTIFRPKSGARLMMFTYVLVLLVFNGVQTVPMMMSSSFELGFTGIRSQWKAVAQEINDIDSDMPLITNNPEMIYYLLDRPAYMKPIYHDVYKQTERADFLDQINLAETRMRAGSIFILFGKPSDEELRVLDLLAVQPLSVFEGVTIYGY